MISTFATRLLFDREILGPIQQKKNVSDPLRIPLSACRRSRLRRTLPGITFHRARLNRFKLPTVARRPGVFASRSINERYELRGKNQGIAAHLHRHRAGMPRMSLKGKPAPTLARDGIDNGERCIINVRG